MRGISESKIPSFLNKLPDPAVRHKSSRLSLLYDRAMAATAKADVDLEAGMNGVAVALASALTYRYEKQIDCVNAESVAVLANLCVNLMVDTILSLSEKDYDLLTRAPMPTVFNTLLDGTTRSPVWAQLLPDTSLVVTTQQNQKINGISLIRLIGVETEDGTQYLPRDRSVVDAFVTQPFRRGIHSEIPQISKNLDTAYEITKTAGGLVTLFLFSVLLSPPLPLNTLFLHLQPIQLQWSLFAMSREDTEKEFRAWTLKAIAHINEKYLGVQDFVKEAG